jgi:hypothetical protein
MNESSGTPWVTGRWAEGGEGTGLDSQAGRLGYVRRPATWNRITRAALQRPPRKQEGRPARLVDLTAASALRPACVRPSSSPAARWVLDCFFQRRLALLMRCCAAGMQQSTPFPVADAALSALIRVNPNQKSQARAPPTIRVGVWGVALWWTVWWCFGCQRHAAALQLHCFALSPGPAWH